MIGFTNAGGGVDRLNMRVFGSTSAPASPKENDIWIKTSAAILNWRITNVTSPGATSPNGLVYIVAVTDGDRVSTANLPTLNVGKNNKILLNFRGCLQLISGKWQSMDAYCYKSRVWVQFSSTWDGTLYNAGEQYTDRTGGWMVRLKGASGGTLTPSLHGYAEKAVTMTTLGKVDLTSFSKLNFTGYGWEDSSGGRDKVHCIVDTAQINPSNQSFPSGVARLDFSGNETSGTYALDISKLSGSYYVGFYAVRNENKIHIDKVWLT